MTEVGILALMQGGMQQLYNLDLMQSCRLAALCSSKKKSEHNPGSIDHPPMSVCLLAFMVDQLLTAGRNRQAAWQRVIHQQLLILEWFHFPNRFQTI